MKDLSFKIQENSSEENPASEWWTSFGNLQQAGLVSIEDEKIIPTQSVKNLRQLWRIFGIG